VDSDEEEEDEEEGAGVGEDNTGILFPSEAFFYFYVLLLVVENVSKRGVMSGGESAHFSMFTLFCQSEFYSVRNLGRNARLNHCTLGLRGHSELTFLKRD
jgi:hypothetical protein